MSLRGRHGGRWSAAHPSMARRALVQFTLLSLATLVVLGALTALLSRHIAREEAVRDARSRAEGIASVAAPLVDTSLRAGDPESVAILALAMERRMQYASVSHILLWDADGQVLWADDDRVVGRRFDLPDELEELLLTGGSTLERPEDREPHPGREAGEGDLLEVYVGTQDADGAPFLFEAYVPAQRVDQDYRALFRDLLPKTLLVLLLTQVATLPLAISLARRIDRANARRSQVLKSSLQSWHVERRGLAQDLHDGVVQDLSAISYALPAVIDRLPDDPAAEEARSTGRRMSRILQTSLTQLRSLVVDLAPDEFTGTGLATALETLTRRAADSGLVVSLQVDEELDVSQAVGGLVYRVVREGLRNVDKHAGADTVAVEVHRSGDVVEVVVTDDGRGVPPRTRREGHDGLRLLDQFVGDLGGTLSLGEHPAGGATLRVTIPVGPELDDDLA